MDKEIEIIQKLIEVHVDNEELDEELTENMQAVMRFLRKAKQ